MQELSTNKMGKGLRDFLVKGFSGISHLDIDKVRQIPLKEFRQRYIEDMQTYFDNHDVPIITCWECYGEISAAEELFRYFGANLHKGCLRKCYGEDSKKELFIDKDKEYFDLILESIAGVIDE